MNKNSFDVYIGTDKQGRYFYTDINGHRYKKRIMENGVPVEIQCDDFAREILKAEKIKKPEDIIAKNFTDYMFDKMTRRAK